MLFLHLTWSKHLISANKKGSASAQDYWFTAMAHWLFLKRPGELVKKELIIPSRPLPPILYQYRVLYKLQTISTQQRHLCCIVSLRSHQTSFRVTERYLSWCCRLLQLFTVTKLCQFDSEIWLHGKTVRLMCTWAHFLYYFPKKARSHL
mgnify:CR=1 FL=1